MGLNLVNLDEATRAKMLEELQWDAEHSSVWLSDNLNATGRRDYPKLLEEAAQGKDDDWLAAQIGNGSRLNTHEVARMQKGKLVTPKMRSNAHTMLGQGEFNRLYMRGLCRLALEAGIEELEVYRARHSDNPRPESQALIGTTIPAADLLRDLRDHKGKDTVFGVPGGPNSGLSVRLPKKG